MVKNLLVFFLLSQLLFGGIVDEKVKIFVGFNRYTRSKKIIDIVLGDKKSYILNDGRVDIVKLLDTLKKNGFINLTLKKPTNIIATFETEGKPILFLKILNTILNSMGFNFYTTKKAIKDGENFSWSISLKSEYLIDPITFSNRLKEFGCFIEDIKKSGDNWSYKISLKNANLVAKKIVKDSSYKLKKPIKPYWIELTEKASKLIIYSYSLNNWHPYIIFFDKNLEVISTYKSSEKEKMLKLDIPNDTKYILIDDEFTLTNIRIGLKIYLK